MAKEGGQGVDVVLENLSSGDSPHCPHGPTLLFERYTLGSLKRFYACSACRDRRNCSFFQWADQHPSEELSKERHKRMLQAQKSPYSQQQYKDRLIEFRQLSLKKRSFCRQCGVLLLPSEVKDHEGHMVRLKVTKSELRKPTRMLSPLDNNKTNAQYLFSDESLKFMLDTIMRLGFSRVLCIGTPRLHEEINLRRVQKQTNLKSLLLDIDQRLEQFYNKKQFCRYNMFNHHFFNGIKTEKIYKHFLEKNLDYAGCYGDLIVVMDPPFGGLVDVLSHTVNRVVHDWRNANSDTSEMLPFMWIFPYFMETRITQTLSTFKMLDYKVNYDNHTVFTTDKKAAKHGSPVRIFTNFSPELIILPSPLYRFCEKCLRYVATENTHCDACNACTSKDGRQYVHCDQCKRCVKPSWVHCDICHTCHLSQYNCQTPNTGCHICGDASHKRRDCPQKYLRQHGQKRKQHSQVYDTKPKKMKKKGRR